MGETRFTIGIDMQCRKVVAKVQIVELLDPSESAHGYDCVVLCDDGIRVLDHLKDLYETHQAAEAVRENSPSCAA
jgi:hypothetical protein